jgi:hypothetical protein
MAWIVATALRGGALHLNLDLVRVLEPRPGGGSRAVFGPEHVVEVAESPDQLLAEAPLRSSRREGRSQDAFAQGLDGWKRDRWAYAERKDPYRVALNLPQHGPLTAEQIEDAFRRAVKHTHPDTGGSAEAFRRVTAARDALLDQLRRMPA